LLRAGKKLLIQRFSFYYFILFILLLALEIPVSSIYSQNEEKKILPESFGKAVLPVGSYPIGIGVNSITNKLYVANQFSNSISVIDGSTDIIGSTIQVGNFPYDLEVNPFNNRVYTTNRVSNSVSVIDGSTNQRLANINVGDSPVGISINPADNLVYIANLNSRSLSIIDSIDNEVTETIELNDFVYGLAVNPLTNLVYISNLVNNTISVLDGRSSKVMVEIPVEKMPTAVNINYQTNLIYVTNYLSNSISVINGTTNKVMSTIQVEENPVDVVVNPLTNKVYVSHNRDNVVSVIDGVTNQKIKELSIKSTTDKSRGNNDPILDIPIKVSFPLIASRLSVNPNTNLIYMTDTISNGIIVISGETDSIVVRLEVEINPDNAGTIECNHTKLQSQNYLLHPINTEVRCTAHATRGHSFDFWSNMTNMISNNTNPITLNVTDNNLLRANFKPSISTETYIGMIAAIVGSTSISAGWYYRKRERSYLNKSMNRIDYTYDALKNNKPEGVKQLENIQKEITNLFKKGKISDSHYNILDKRITDLINTFYRED
jgi:YVTN family beta-propeller protein